MAELIRTKDWSRTPLGPIDKWPHALKVLTDTILTQKMPAVILWGPELIQIYNDGYRVIAGGKHPNALGQSNYECWPEVVEWTRPRYTRVLNGESISIEDEPLSLSRNGFPENVFLTVSYSPVKNDEGVISGVLAVVFETTGKVKSEDARRNIESERERLVGRLKLVLDAGGLGWWSFDISTRYVFWDESARRIFGIPDEYFEYEKILSLMHPEDRGGVRNSVQAALDPIQAKAYTVEYRFTRPDGSVRWIASKGQAHFEGEGNERRAMSFFGTVADITDAKEREIQIREDAERLSLALSAAELGNWEWDPVTDIMVLSDRAAELFNVKKNTPVTRSQMREILDEEYRDVARLTSEQSLKNRTDYEIEYSVRHNDGKQLWISATGRGLYDQNGELIRMFGVIQDITARKKVEKERELLLQKIESERLRLSSAFMQSPVFMCILRGVDHVFEFANEQYYKLVGNREILNKSVKEALPELAGQGYFELLDEVYQSGTRFVGRDMPVSVQRTLDEVVEQRDVEFVFQPLMESDGIVNGIFVHGVDITESKKIQREREQLLESERSARSEAERASRMKDEFLATLSHELRTPLNAVFGWSQILRKGVKNPEDLSKGLETIERNVRAQAQIIDDLLDMNRIISGKIRLDVQRLDLADVAKAALETVRPAAEAKGIKLISTLDPLTGYVMGDPNRLQQILWNLLSNAIKFTQKDGRVQVILRRVNSHVEVSVSDSGIGIAEDFLPYVFDRFRQGDSSITRKHGGLGLGLSIVKQLVELQGGSIRAFSKGDGAGASFIVSLPISIVQTTIRENIALQYPRSESAMPTRTNPSVSLQGVRALVVDDEPDARTLVKTIIRRLRCDGGNCGIGRRSY